MSTSPMIFHLFNRTEFFVTYIALSLAPFSSGKVVCKSHEIHAESPHNRGIVDIRLQALEPFFRHQLVRFDSCVNTAVDA